MRAQCIHVEAAIASTVQAAEYFRVPEEAKEAPKVDFSTPLAVEAR
jgi:hypothetical protein